MALACSIVMLNTFVVVNVEIRAGLVMTGTDGAPLAVSRAAFPITRLVHAIHDNCSMVAMVTCVCLSDRLHTTMP